MAELLGRVERLAVNTGGQQQVAGQAHVRIDLSFGIIDDLKFRLCLTMSHAFKISIE